METLKTVSKVDAIDDATYCVDYLKDAIGRYGSPRLHSPTLNRHLAIAEQKLEALTHPPLAPDRLKTIAEMKAERALWRELSPSL